MSEIENKKQQVALIVLDGWGYREEKEHNAIAQANTPFFDSLWASYPHSLLEASGLAVGLPKGQIGNSEVGHMTIGVGSTLDTDLVRIEKSIQDGSFFTNEAFKQLFTHIKKHNSAVHVIGLVSDGGVHSHQDHLFAFLKLCQKENLRKDQVVLHVFTDGRDTMPKTAVAHLARLEEEMKETGIGVFGSIGGRYHGMDRAGNWDRIGKVEDALFKCEGNVCRIEEYGSVAAFMNKQYEKDPTGKIDEYMEHYVCKEGGCDYPVKEYDGIFFFNFRADRARQLTEKILERKEKMDLFYVSMTQYGDEIDTVIAFKQIKPENSLAEILSTNGLTQSHISESEKFPHVTFFFNGCKDGVREGEVHIKVESNTHIATHDLAPEMKAREIVDAALLELERGVNFILVNFPNADVVGHTGNIPAIIRAVETADSECKRLVEAIITKGGVAFVTADHGNAELNFDEASGEKHTAHTTSLVPAIITRKDLQMHNGTIADIAPTILSLFNITKPASMTGHNLIN